MLELVAGLGLAWLTFAVVVVVRVRDFWVRLHVPGVVHGVLVLALAAALASGGEVAARCAAIALFVLVTTPISNHALARTHARRRGVPGEGEDR